VTALNPVIGYEKGAAIAKQAYKEGRAIRDVAAAQTQLTPEQLRELLDPLELTKGGIKG
jgi:fumarate hydratase class II